MKKLNKVRIVNDGTIAQMTQITNLETGERIDHVTRLDISIDLKHDYPRAVLVVELPVVDVITSDIEIKYQCPHCGEERQIYDENT
jgi:hypothetical protein